MARNNYFDKGDPYSEWHRSLKNDLRYVDIDSCGICNKCKQPIYLAETTFDVGQSWKATTATEWLAQAANIPSFLIFYKVNENREVISLRIKQLTPIKDRKEFLLKPEAWVQAMELLQDRHNLVCKKRDVA